MLYLLLGSIFAVMFTLLTGSKDFTCILLTLILWPVLAAILVYVILEAVFKKGVRRWLKKN